MESRRVRCDSGSSAEDDKTTFGQKKENNLAPVAKAVGRRAGRGSALARLLLALLGLFAVARAGILPGPLGLQAAGAAESLPTSVSPSRPPQIDGQVSPGEWDGATGIALEHGLLLVQNDAVHLYLLIDLTGATGDPGTEDEPGGNDFSLSFDVDGDRAITPGVDVNYGLDPGTRKLGVQRYLGPGRWTGLGDTRARLGSGFGPSPNAQVSHRIWELAIGLPELEAGPNRLLRMGLRVRSQDPSFEDHVPVHFAFDFSDLVEINLVTQDVQLLVLAHEEFGRVLGRLEEHKEKTGITTYIESWQNLNDTYYHEGRDVQERIKKGIAAYHAHEGTMYVMLVGDSDMFPVRSCKGYHTEWGVMWFPSDLYYADLYAGGEAFDDWDSGPSPYGGNNIFCEMDFDGFAEQNLDKLNLDRIDRYPDVGVGRVPASTAAEVATYVDKIIRYEIGAYQADWFRRALWIVDCSGCGVETKNRLDPFLTIEHNFTLYKRYFCEDNWDQATFDERADAINSLMNDGLGFVNHCGHGGRFRWQDWYDSSKMSGLTNKNKLPVVYSVSCGTARFFWDGCGCAGCTPIDLYQNTQGYEWRWEDCQVKTVDRPEPAAVQPSTYDRESFAEEFLVKRDTGGIAYIGCTFKQEYGGDDLDYYFFEGVAVGEESWMLGSLWNYALTKWLDNVEPWYYYAYIHMHKIMLFGDPSLRVGGVWTPKHMVYLPAVSREHP